MSQDNVELARSLLAAWARRDIDAALALVHQDIEWRPALLAGGVERTAYRGHRAIRDWFLEVDEEWAELSQDVEEIRDLGGGRVLMLGSFHAVGRESGAAVDQPHGIVFTIAGDKIAAGRAFASQEEALKAAGDSR